MACHAEHEYLLDVALAHLPEEVRACVDEGTAHELCVLPDRVGEWPWHKPPLSLWVLELGGGEVRRAMEAGDRAGAGYTLSLLHHYAVDTLAVSHAWLDFLGEMEDFESIEVLAEDYHDPVENCIVGALEGLSVPDTARTGRLREQWPRSVRRCYAIGAAIHEAFLGGEDVLELCLEGVRNTAECMPALVAALLNGDVGLAGKEQVRLAGELWPLADLLTWSGERIAAEATSDQAVARWQARRGYADADIFFAPESCGPAALKVREHYLAGRRQWREEILPQTYGVTLPPRRRIGRRDEDGSGAEPGV
ncbi:MAG: hypothetical protein U9R79_00170 [Armatimonadota bacterium]|nr:hypothetical protein [Armatimonadota bacterium]